MDTPTDGPIQPTRPRGRRPNPERKAATRKKLIDAALASLVEAGYGATTTTEVVHRSGLSRGALFAHFPTRDALMAAAAEHAMADLSALYEAAFAAAMAESGEPGAVVAIRCLNEVMHTPTTRAVMMLFAEAATSSSLLEALRPVAEANHTSLLERARVILPDLDQDDGTRQAFLVMWFSLLGLASQRYVYLAPGAEAAVLDGLTSYARFALVPGADGSSTPSA